jgi:hypothetical protein
MPFSEPGLCPELLVGRCNQHYGSFLVAQPHGEVAASLTNSLAINAVICSELFSRFLLHSFLCISPILQKTPHGTSHTLRLRL